MKRLCLGLALLLAGCAGTEVQGIVRDQSTGEPLEGATVQIGDDSARTDEEGRFELDVDEDELGRIKVDKEGYAPTTETLSIDGSAGEVDHELRLRPSNAAGAPTGMTEPKRVEGELEADDGRVEADVDVDGEPSLEAGAEKESTSVTPSSPREGQDEGMSGLRKAEDEELRRRLKGAETDLRVEPSGK